MTKMKRPSVSSVTGSVSRISSGRISVLMRPSASAAISAALKESTFTHGKTYGSASSASALTSQTSRRRMREVSARWPALARGAGAIGFEGREERRVDGRGHARGARPSAPPRRQATAPRAGCPRRGRSASTTSFPREGRPRTSSAGRRNRRRARCPWRGRPPTPRVSPPRASRGGRDRRAATPIGCRATLVKPENAARNANFSHSARRMSAESSASMPAPLHAASSASAADCCAGMHRAETQPRHRSGMHDDAGLADRRRDVRDAAHHALGADDRADPLDALDAVLERDDDAALRDERPYRGRRAFRIPELDREQDDVGRREARRIVGDGGSRERGVAERALDGRARARASRRDAGRARRTRRRAPPARAARRSIRRRRRRPSPRCASCLPPSPPVNSDTSAACTGPPRARRCSAPASPTAASASRPASTSCSRATFSSRCFGST